MLRTSVGAPSMFGLQSGAAMTLAVESGRHSDTGADGLVAARLPFAIQHLLGIDAAHQCHPHHQQQLRHRDVSALTHHLHQSPVSATDDVTAYGPWTAGHVTPTTCYRHADAMMVDDVIGRRQSSLGSRGLVSAAAAAGLPSPLPTLTDNVSGKPPSSTCVSSCMVLSRLPAKVR